MGTLFYSDTRTPITIEDRALSHMLIVVLSKLRRGEGFGLSWDKDGGGRNTVWINPTSTLQFEFSGEPESTINHSWIEALDRAADSTMGLSLVGDTIHQHLEDVDPDTGHLSERID